jgi:hypothetical protein
VPLDCSCLDTGPRYSDRPDQRSLGRDETDGRSADVEVMQCGKCSRLWLHYQVEYEAFSRSGRWAVALIDEDTANGMKPEEAAGFIDEQDWYIFGGSHWGHSGKRGSGNLNWGP